MIDEMGVVFRSWFFFELANQLLGVDVYVRLKQELMVTLIAIKPDWLPKDTHKSMTNA